MALDSKALALIGVVVGLGIGAGVAVAVSGDDATDDRPSTTIDSTSSSEGTFPDTSLDTTPASGGTTPGSIDDNGGGDNSGPG